MADAQTQTQPDENDPFASLGGGVKTANGGWVPKGHPDAGGASGTAAPGYNDPSSVSSTIPQQADAASSYSGTPTAAPTQNTSNQGMQDVVRNSLLERATQGTNIDTNDPAFRQQADTYAAASERARRNANDQDAEANFAGSGETSSGYNDVQQRAVNESAAQGQGAFEANLAHSELVARRQEITEALSGAMGMISADQARELQRQQMELDAAIKRESLASSSSLASQDIALRQTLGMGGLNLDALRLQLQNQQANNSLGLDASYRSGLLNNSALAMLLG